jgi:hypothetical protein
MAKGKYSVPRLIGPVLPAGRPSLPVAVSMAAPRQTPGMTAAGSRPSRTGRVAPDCLTHMCHHVQAADQRNLHLALLQTNDHSIGPDPVIAPSLLPIAAKICRRSVSQCS